jgi:ethanolamine permease
VVGIAAIFSDSLITISGMPLTACIVTMSVFGAIVMYITSMAALFKLRRSEPKLIRPFRAPLYPWRRPLPWHGGTLSGGDGLV